MVALGPNPARGGIFTGPFSEKKKWTVETLASDVFETLLDKLKKVEMMSLAIDESTDSSDVA